MRRLLLLFPLLLLILVGGNAYADRPPPPKACQYTASFIETQMRNLELSEWLLFADKLNSACGEEARVSVRVIFERLMAKSPRTAVEGEALTRARSYLHRYGEPKLQHALTCLGARALGQTSWTAWPTW